MKAGKSLKSKKPQHLLEVVVIVLTLVLSVFSAFAFPQEAASLASARAAMERGKACYAKSDWPGALAAFEEARRSFEKLGERRELAKALHNAGIVRHHLGDYAHALACYEKSLALREELGDMAGAAACLNNIGASHGCRGDSAAALEFYGKSLALNQELGDKANMAVTLGNISVTLTESRRAADGLSQAGRALTLAEELGSANELYRAHFALAMAHTAMGTVSEAAFHYRAAIEMAESMRTLLSEKEHKSGLMETKLEAYEGLTRVLLGPEGAVEGSLFMASP
jgi:tetratricopeptide (TPR) repeat protein